MGRELRDLVCGIKNSETLNIIRDAGYSISELNEFINTLRLSGFSSIDWFLENHPEFIAIGKAAIAATLIPYENPDRLFPPEAPESHWYELLLNILDKPLGAFSDNKLSIITFNYDRSLEHYLFTILKNRRKSEQRAIECMQKFEIIHVHGMLGGLTPLTKIGREYQPKLDHAAIRLAADQLIIVGEASGETNEFRRARELLSDAQRIAFLGFGYHPESVKRLGIFNEPWDEEKRTLVRVGGTSRDIPSHEWKNIKEKTLNHAIPNRYDRPAYVYHYLHEAEPLDEEF